MPKLLDCRRRRGRQMRELRRNDLRRLRLHRIKGLSGRLLLDARERLLAVRRGDGGLILVEQGG